MDRQRHMQQLTAVLQGILTENGHRAFENPRLLRGMLESRAAEVEGGLSEECRGIDWLDRQRALPVMEEAVRTSDWKRREQLMQHLREKLAEEPEQGAPAELLLGAFEQANLQYQNAWDAEGPRLDTLDEDVMNTIPERPSRGTGGSGFLQKLPWILLAVAVLAGIAVGVFLFTRDSAAASGEGGEGEGEGSPAGGGSHQTAESGAPVSTRKPAETAAPAFTPNPAPTAEPWQEGGGTESAGVPETTITLTADDVGPYTAAGEPYVLPMDPMVSEVYGESTPLLKVEMPDWAELPVIVPVANVSLDTAAVVFNDGGIGTLAAKSAVTEEGLKLFLSGTTELMIFENPVYHPDVKPTDWYYDAVAFVSSRQIFGSAPDGDFIPDGVLTRGSMAQVLYSLEGYPEPDAIRIFVDVPEDTWYSRPISWAVGAGLMSGVSTGKFAPDDVTTREQMAVALWNSAGRPYLVEDLSQFRDEGEIHEYARLAMGWAVHYGILSGKSSDVLDPLGTVSRAEAAAAIMNFCSRAL